MLIGYPPGGADGHLRGGKTDVRTLLHPILLLISGVFTVVGLGVYFFISSGIRRGDNRGTA